MSDSTLQRDVEQIEYLLRKVASAFKKRGREILGGFDITPPQFDALLVISRQDNLTMGDLCAHLYLASSTVTDLVDRMEKGGLVLRERDAEDRRVIRLRITPRGRALIDQVLRARHAYLAGILERVHPGDRAAVIAALQRLHRLMAPESPV